MVKEIIDLKTKSILFLDEKSLFKGKYHGFQDKRE